MKLWPANRRAGDEAEGVAVAGMSRSRRGSRLPGMIAVATNCGVASTGLPVREVAGGRAVKPAARLSLTAVAPQELTRAVSPVALGERSSLLGERGRSEL